MEIKSIQFSKVNLRRNLQNIVNKKTAKEGLNKWPQSVAGETRPDPVAWPQWTHVLHAGPGESGPSRRNSRMALTSTQNQRGARRSPSTDRKRGSDLPPKCVTVPRGPSEGARADRVQTGPQAGGVPGPSNSVGKTGPLSRRLASYQERNVWFLLSVHTANEFQGN